MTPTKILSITTEAGNFDIEHGLGRVPYAVIPASQDNGTVRFTPALYDAVNVYLNASAADLNAVLLIW